MRPNRLLETRGAERSRYRDAGTECLGASGLRELPIPALSFIRSTTSHGAARSKYKYEELPTSITLADSIPTWPCYGYQRSCRVEQQVEECPRNKVGSVLWCSTVSHFIVILLHPFVPFRETLYSHISRWVPVGLTDKSSETQFVDTLSSIRRCSQLSC